MNITPYSFLMSLIWSSVVITLLSILRQNSNFVCKFGVNSLTMLYIGFSVRLVTPLEFSFVNVISLDDGLYAKLNTLTNIRIHDYITILDAMLTIWIAVSIFKLIKLVVIHYSFIKSMLKLNNNFSPQIDECRRKIEAEIKCQHVDIICSQAFDVPMCAGLKKKLILLPDRNYENTELYYIVKHEYTHLKNRDIYLKMLIEVFIAIFWWNPFVYLLRYNLGHTLELKCDLNVVGGKSRKEKALYLETIISSIKSSSNSSYKKMRFVTAEFSNHLNAKNLKQRFNLVINYKPDKKRNLIYTSAIVFVLSITLFVSYMFVLQPGYNPPELGYINDAHEITPHNSYIIKTEDNEYILHSDNGVKHKINRLYKEELITNGFQIKEEVIYEE